MQGMIQAFRRQVEEVENNVLRVRYGVAPAVMYVLNVSHHHVEDNLVGCIGGYLPTSGEVFSLADQDRRGIEFAIGSMRQPEARWQMPPF